MANKKELVKSVLILGEIDAETVGPVISALLETEWETEEEIITTLNIYISSEGGLLNYCFALVDLIECLKARFNFKVNTFALGEASSAGFFLFLIGDERTIFPSCRMFVHEHLTSSCDQTYQERKKEAPDQKTVYDTYVKHTAKHLEISIARAKTLIRKNKYLTKNEMKKWKIDTHEVD